LKQVAELRAATVCDWRGGFMAKADIAALLAMTAALFIAVGDVIHQRSARDVTDELVGHLEPSTRLLRDGQWWLGSLVAAIGFALQAAALGLGSVQVGSILGIVVLGETLKTDDTAWFALGLAIVAMVVATVALARGQALSTASTAQANTAA
jgi:hypothetical protein